MSSDNWTVPVDPSAGVIVRADYITYALQNIQAIFNGLVGDASADALMLHRHKSGTYAARPAAGNAGRVYFATDIPAMYRDDGAAWQLISEQFYDTFDRGDSTTLGSADSGHAWTENAGNLEISGNALRALSATALATVDLGGFPYSGSYAALFNPILTGGEPAIILRFVDSSNYLFVDLTEPGDAMRIVKVVSGTPTTLKSMALTVANGVVWMLEVRMVGAVILAVARTYNTPSATVATLEYSTKADTYTPFTAATRIGLRLTETSQKIDHFSATLP